ncbi:MAG: non-canonical purine NTP pyrophosphatase [Mariprofundus sp.]|nr:non-canonical purine NTP pyrophosphatase [Mariprofundus sp.]
MTQLPIIACKLFWGNATKERGQKRLKVVIACNQLIKRKELAEILVSLGIDVVAPESTIRIDVLKNCDTLAGNARKMAEEFSRAYELPALACESALIIDSLDHKKRFLSQQLGDANDNEIDNNNQLLQALHNADHRHARLICATHLVFPDHSPSITAEGSIEGEILTQPAGSTGFDYDPLFYLHELDKSLALTTLAEKIMFSHRGIAMRSLVKKVQLANEIARSVALSPSNKPQDNNPPITVVLASNQAAKRREISALLKTINIKVAAPNPTIHINIEKNVDDYAGSAGKQAQAFADAYSLPALSVLSGLFVDALVAPPGFHTNTYAGKKSSHQKNNAKLLQAMNKVDVRDAHFQCYIHLAFPNHQQPIVTEARMDGAILRHNLGSSHCSFAPLFYIPSLAKSFAQATLKEKATSSHYGIALRAIAEQLSKSTTQKEPAQ